MQTQQKSDNKMAIITLLLLVVAGVGGFFALNMGGENGSGGSNNEVSSKPVDKNTPNNIDYTNSAEVRLSIQDFSFKDQHITIKKGTKVTWINNDLAEHTVTSESGNVLDSELFGKGESFEYTFDTVGFFDYFCVPHPNMKASVTVVE